MMSNFLKTIQAQFLKIKNYKKNKTLFLLTLPRSGSTLLTIILSKNEEVYCPPEPWLLLGLDSLKFVNSSVPANGVTLKNALDEFFNSRRLDFFKIAAKSIYHHILVENNKKVFLDKTPRYYLCLDLVERFLDADKAILLKRNPLDIAASYFTTWQVNLAQVLKNEEITPEFLDFTIGFKYLIEFQKRNNVLSVQYENLVLDTLTETNRICDYLEIKRIANPKIINPENSSYINSDFGDKKVFGSNQVHANSINNYESVFNDDEIKFLLEAIGEDVFVQFGYADIYYDLIKRYSIDTSINNIQNDLIRFAKNHIENKIDICRKNEFKIMFNQDDLSIKAENFEGISYQEGWGRWSDFNLAQNVNIKTPVKMLGKVEIIITAKGIGNSRRQSTKVLVGPFVYEILFDENIKTFSFSLVLIDSVELITIIPPYQTEVYENKRVLGIGLVSLEVLTH